MRDGIFQLEYSVTSNLARQRTDTDEVHYFWGLDVFMLICLPWEAQLQPKDEERDERMGLW